MRQSSTKDLLDKLVYLQDQLQKLEAMGYQGSDIMRLPLNEIAEIEKELEFRIQREYDLEEE